MKFNVEINIGKKYLCMLMLFFMFAFGGVVFAYNLGEEGVNPDFHGHSFKEINFTKDSISGEVLDLSSVNNLQKRIVGSCGEGEGISNINSNGGIECVDILSKREGFVPDQYAYYGHAMSLANEPVCTYAYFPAKDYGESCNCSEGYEQVKGFTGPIDNKMSRTYICYKL